METGNKKSITMPDSDIVKIYAQNLGQTIEVEGHFGKKTLELRSINIDGDLVAYDNQGEGYTPTIFGRRPVILLKPLATISEADKNSIREIEKNYRGDGEQTCHFGKTWDLSGWEDDDSEFTNMCDFSMHSFYFLQEKGYALPYKNWSVEQLVEFGIYKLID